MINLLQMVDSRLFKNLTDNEFEQVMNTVDPVYKAYKPDEIIFSTGDIIDSFGIIKSGQLHGKKYHYEGDVELVEVYIADDLVGLDIVCTPTRISPLEIISKGETEILVFKYDRLCELLPAELDRIIRNNIIQILSNENMKKLYKIDMLYKKSLRERILVFLRNMEMRLGKSEFRIRMDREQFAQYLGVNRSALSHELSLMQQEGLIRFKKDYFELKKSVKNKGGR